MDFIKLQGTGNDFVLIDARAIQYDWSTLARKMCHRHYGVGADGLLLLLSSEKANLRLRMFNPDGSEAEACGNGLRCFARYAQESGLVDNSEFQIETLAGNRKVKIDTEKGTQVTMGIPILEPSSIPVLLERTNKSGSISIADYPMIVGDFELGVSCISMGNPHAVCFLNQPVPDFPLDEVGPRVEHHQIFPNRTNFEVANIISPNKIKARVWERGAGETLSCGSGACAIAVVSLIRGLSNNPVEVTLPGGTLTVNWDQDEEVLLSGPAETVFHGIWQD